MTLLGLHHITLVCSDAQRTVDFYTRVLGQRFVKKTVNFDLVLGRGRWPPRHTDHLL